jgi:hypothetical protein
MSATRPLSGVKQPLVISLWRGDFLATRFPARAPGNSEAGEPASAAASALARLRGPKQGSVG